MAGFVRAPFQHLTEAELNRPTLVPLTEGEKLVIATTMGKPEQAMYLEKHMAISMPNVEACHQYIEWYDENLHDAGSGTREPFAMMIEEDWLRNYGEQAMREMVRSMFFKGKPTVHWVFVYNFVNDMPDNVGCHVSRRAAAAA
jgi:hypothetical protein